MIETDRLALLPATVQTLRAEARKDLAGFASLLSVAKPEAWPPDLYDDDAVAWSLRELEEDPNRAPWNTYYFVLKSTRTLLGAGGFMHGPDKDGCVEIGYSILSAHQRNGYASEAAGAMVHCAFKDPRVTRVIAHTFPDLAGSIGVLTKNGFVLTGPGAEAGTVRYTRARD